MNKTDRLAKTLTVLESRELDAFIDSLPEAVPYPMYGDDHDVNDYYHSAMKRDGAIDDKIKEIIARREEEFA